MKPQQQEINALLRALYTKRTALSSKIAVHPQVNEINECIISVLEGSKSITDYIEKQTHLP